MLYHAFVIDLRWFVAENGQILILVFKKVVFQKRLVAGVLACESHIRILRYIDRQVVAWLQEEHPRLVHAASAVLQAHHFRFGELDNRFFGGFVCEIH
ncbi:hypothetical protein D3C87_1633830 [compost metagenome]